MCPPLVSVCPIATPGDRSLNEGKVVADDGIVTVGDLYKSAQ
jgi:hypothetical protein